MTMTARSEMTEAEFASACKNMGYASKLLIDRYIEEKRSTGVNTFTEDDFIKIYRRNEEYAERRGGERWREFYEAPKRGVRRG